MLEQPRFVEMGLPRQGDGVVSPLPHAPDRRDARGEEDKPLDPLGAFDNTLRVEDARARAFPPGQALQHLVGKQLIGYALRRRRQRQKSLDLVPSRENPYGR